MKTIQQYHRRKMKQDKRGQIDGGIITFAVVVIALIFIAPVLLKLVRLPLQKFGDNIATQAPAANESVQFIQTRFTNMWDTIILLGFIFSVIVLFITAFLVDVHPAFLVLYIFVAFLLMFFTPNIIYAMQSIWENQQYSEESSLMPLTKFVLDNYAIILLAIIFVTGIIMYGKLRYGGRSPV